MGWGVKMREGSRREDNSQYSEELELEKDMRRVHVPVEYAARWKTNSSVPLKTEVANKGQSIGRYVVLVEVV